MQCTFFEKICSIGGTFCKKNGEKAEKDCPEAAELSQIEKSPCPILEAQGYEKSKNRCDQTLIARVTLVKSLRSCNRGEACLVDEVLPGKRAELSQGLPGSKPISLKDLAPMIKESIKRKKTGQCLLANPAR